MPAPEGAVAWTMPPGIVGALSFDQDMGKDVSADATPRGYPFALTVTTPGTYDVNFELEHFRRYGPYHNSYRFPFQLSFINVYM